MELVAEGTELNKLSEAKPLFAEGDKGELRLYIDKKLTDDEIYNLENELCNKGVTLTKPIKQEAHIVFIGFQKASEPLDTIKDILGKVKDFFINGWQLLKEGIGVPWWGWAIGVGAIGLLIFTLRR